MKTELEAVSVKVVIGSGALEKGKYYLTQQENGETIFLVGLDMESMQAVFSRDPEDAPVGEFEQVSEAQEMILLIFGLETEITKAW